MQRSGGGILSVAGVEVTIACHGDTPDVKLKRPNGKDQARRSRVARAQ
ncbi:MAG: hypothetical protein R3B07_09665 [Polyangiaceae bacterium]